MLAKVTCASCQAHLGVYEKSEITDTDIQLHREFAVCPECESYEKVVEVISAADVEPELLPEPEPEPETPPPPAEPWYKFW